MTRDECRAGLERLAKGWGVTITSEQLSAIHQRVQHVQAGIWVTAVDDLLANHLAAPRSGLLDHILKSVDHVEEDRRKALVRQERREADARFEGRPPLIPFADPMEKAYGMMRMRAIRLGLDSGHYAETLRDELLAWIDVPEHAAWAKAQVVAAPPGQVDATTLLQSLLSEIQQWEDRARAAV